MFVSWQHESLKHDLSALKCLHHRVKNKTQLGRYIDWCIIILSLSSVICIFNVAGLAGSSPTSAGCELWFLIVYSGCHAAIIHYQQLCLVRWWVPRENTASLTIGQTGLVGSTGVLEHNGVWSAECTDCRVEYQYLWLSCSVICVARLDRPDTDCSTAALQLSRLSLQSWLIIISQI